MVWSQIKPPLARQIRPGSRSTDLPGCWTQSLAAVPSNTGKLQPEIVFSSISHLRKLFFLHAR
jgi:hypothetical protein